MGAQNDLTLRTWKRPFSSLHELFCAVETSWTYEGQELDYATYLEAFDANVGPVTPPSVVNNLLNYRSKFNFIPVFGFISPHETSATIARPSPNRFLP